MSGYFVGPSRGFEMFGPLPALHRFVLVVAALVVCSGIGFWLGAMPEISVDIRAGLLAGLVAGVGASFVLVHDFHHRHSGRDHSHRRLS